MQLYINELVEMGDALGVDGGALQQAAAIQGGNDVVAQLVQQVHPLRQSNVDQQQQLRDEISQLRTFITQQFGIVGRNVDRLALQAPRQRHTPASQVPVPPGAPAGAVAAATTGRPAHLSRCPRTLFTLWQEYQLSKECFMM